MTSVGEDGGTVQVCATLDLTGDSTVTAIDIDITLATSDGEDNISNYCTS